MRQKWTTDDIPDLSGKITIITGANSGIGLETARELARKGADIIMACRNMDTAKAAEKEIMNKIPRSKLEIIQIDLADLKSVYRFAEVFKSKYSSLDILINNAGIMMAPYGKTKDGFEQQFGINHLGHFALTGLLIDRILNTPHSRIINVSSNAHRIGKIDFDNLMYEGGKGYSPTRAYGRSKLANLLFTYELERRFKAAGSKTIAAAAHPGYTHTHLTRYLEKKWYFRLFSPLGNLIAQKAEMGALPIIRAAIHNGVIGGQYYGPDGLLEQRGYPVVIKSSQASYNKDTAQKIWEVSEQLTGVNIQI
jgi:NAD(P)-dependent dehydrogenase (short-subunit alcohol dehydrogenase family)